MNKNPFTFEQFKELYSKVPRLCVDLVIKTENGVVLTKRNIPPYRGFWHMPRGTVYYKETLEEACKRVAKKELGVDISVKGMLGVLEHPDFIKENGWGWPVSIVFLARIVSGKLSGNEEGEEVKEFKEMPDKMIPNHKDLIESFVEFLEDDCDDPDCEEEHNHK
jgi:ADP-ribose pyrophosphatase YjhB (NUDIX family)